MRGRKLLGCEAVGRRGASPSVGARSPSDLARFPGYSMRMVRGFSLPPRFSAESALPTYVDPFRPAPFSRNRSLRPWWFDPITAWGARAAPAAGVGANRRRIL